MKRAKWLRQVEILGSLSERQLALLAGVLQAITFEDGETIIRQGDVGDTFYIVEEGTVSCQIGGKAESGVDACNSRSNAVLNCSQDRETYLEELRYFGRGIFLPISSLFFNDKPRFAPF